MREGKESFPSLPFPLLSDIPCDQRYDIIVYVDF